MTNANMKLVVLHVSLENELESPAPHLDDGEHIVTRVVELDKLASELRGAFHHQIYSFQCSYDDRVFKNTIRRCVTRQ